MTTEPTTSGSVPPLPPWAYWALMSVAAAIPVLLVSGIIPSPFDALAAALNAICAVLTGTSRPSPQAERTAAAAAATVKRSLPPPGTIATLALVSGALLLGGCSLRFGGPIETAGTEPEWTEADCRSYDEAFTGWTIASGVIGGLGGAVGITAAAWTEAPEDVSVALTAAGGVAAAIAGAAAAAAAFYGQRYAQRCTDPILFGEDAGWGPRPPSALVGTRAPTGAGGP